jgi:hypothetical protein
VSVNTVDNSSVFHLAFTIVRSSGPDVSVSNVALAVADCAHCRSVAIAVQLAFVWPVPSTLAATNVSVAVTTGCATCDAFAAALQYVIASKDPVALSQRGRSEIERAERQLRALESTGLSPAQLKASITGIADQLGNALGTGVVAAPNGGKGAVQDPPPLVVGSTRPLAYPPVPNLGALDKVPSVATIRRPSPGLLHQLPLPKSVLATGGAGRSPVATSGPGNSGAVTDRVVRPTAPPLAPRHAAAAGAPALPVATVGTGARPSVGPSIAVVPSTGLLPGAQVTVAGAAFPARAAMEVDECELPAAEALDPARCSPVADSLLLTGPDGTVRGTATVVSGAVGTAAGAACPAAPPATCALALVAVGSPAAEAAAPIVFAPTVPMPLAAALAPHPVAAASAVTQADAPAPAPRANAFLSHTAAVVGRSRGQSRRWALGLMSLVLAGALTGVARARAGLRRPRLGNVLATEPLPDQHGEHRDNDASGPAGDGWSRS